jgi:hypothetical protein
VSSILNSDFPIARDSYLSFDGQSIKEVIRKRLNQTGVFTDQNQEGSNISALNDIIAMVFSLLLYNLNKTSNESQFSEATIYENINRIVKLLDYKPRGHQSASLSFNLAAQNINAGTYNIPRYSTITIGGIKYSLASDFGFQKTVDTTLETIDLSSDDSLLFQGYYQEFPTYTAEGVDNELLYLTANDTTLVDHTHIDVYVKSVGGKWETWNKTQSLYLSNGTAKVYEVRFNEKKRYEIKFGNNINGKRLSSGDQVAIYYLASDGTKGEVGANVLDGKKMQLYSAVRYSQIQNDLEIYNPYISQTNLNNLQFSNSCGSTGYAEPETVAQIKANAPGTFRSQYSLTTANSYENYIKSNFSNIVQDVRVVNNQDYLDGYIKYFYDLGLTKPHLESRALFNHQLFADSCSFNNVYLFVVPKTVKNTLGYLSASQKSLIISTLKEEKTLTADVIPLDPVYLAFDFGLGDSNTTVFDDVEQTQIVIEKTGGSRRSDSSIINDVNQVIQDYFARSKNRLGKLISVSELTTNILGLEGVKSVSTARPDLGITANGLRLVQWNPIYVDVSFESLNGNLQLTDFQFGYSFTQDFTSRIIIQ